MCICDCSCDACSIMHNNCAFMTGVKTFVLVVFFFFKQKTAYEMRISDWSSDVCSSDLLLLTAEVRSTPVFSRRPSPQGEGGRLEYLVVRHSDRKSVVSGKSVSVRVDLGGRRIIKKKKGLDHDGNGVRHSDSASVRD